MNPKFPTLAPLQPSALFSLQYPEPHTYGSIRTSPGSAINLDSSPATFQSHSEHQFEHEHDHGRFQSNLEAQHELRRRSMFNPYSAPLNCHSPNMPFASPTSPCFPRSNSLTGSNLKSSNDSESEPAIISHAPTMRALKAKRSPPNKCPCGGKEDCPDPNCNKSAGTFACPVCSIEFSRKNSMRRHVLTHINLRPYECTACQKSFYRSDIYKRHLSSKKCRRHLMSHDMMTLPPPPSDITSFINHHIPTQFHP